jgi:serine/threonine protein kinase
VMEYVEGSPQGSDLKEALKKRGKLDVIAVGEILNQVGAALTEAHSLSLIHRDIKPANILLGVRDQRSEVSSRSLTPALRPPTSVLRPLLVKLSDFGIAKDLEQASDLTESGSGTGTPRYMSPEQAIGTAEYRSDIYSLGVVLYEALTGQPPFIGNPTSLLWQHANVEPTLPHQLDPSIPPAISKVILQALAKQPQDRYATAKSFAEAYQNALSSSSISSNAEPFAEIVVTTPLVKIEQPDLTPRPNYAGITFPPNPFRDTQRVEQSLFVTREAMLLRLRSVLEVSSLHLQGEAKIGKSSLLWLLYQEQKAKNLPAVFGDFQFQTIEEIIAEIAEVLGQPSDTAWISLRRTITAQPFYLFLDELDYAPEMNFTLEWGRRFRGLSNSMFRLITGGRNEPKDVLPQTGVGSEWYNFLAPEILEPFTPAEAAKLITQRLPQAIAELLFPPHIQQQLFRLSGGHPFRLMRAAFRYYDQQTNPHEQTHDWQIRYQNDLKHFGL